VLDLKAISMKKFSSSTFVSPDPGLRRASMRWRARLGKSAQVSGRAIASIKAMPRALPG
jgi:hypothetical protein